MWRFLGIATVGACAFIGLIVAINSRLGGVHVGSTTAQMHVYLCSQTNRNAHERTIAMAESNQNTGHIFIDSSFSLRSNHFVLGRVKEIYYWTNGVTGIRDHWIWRGDF
jgi:hypothetical protein